MTASNKGASASARITKFTKFFSCNPEGDALFAVCDGLPVDVALEQSSCFLAAAMSVAYRAAETRDGDEMHASAYLIEMSKALVDAAISAIESDNGEVAK